MDLFKFKDNYCNMLRYPIIKDKDGDNTKHLNKCMSKQ